jgi:hypothetical protein
MVNAQKITSNQQSEEFTICSLCSKIVGWWKGDSYSENEEKTEVLLEGNEIAEKSNAQE